MSTPNAPPDPSPTPASSRFAVGQMLAGRFRILSPLGRGYRSDVYEAEDVALNRQVALKFLHRRLEDDPLHVKRFLSQLQLLQPIADPHVCRLWDLGRHVEGGKTLPFISMELIEGDTLQELLRQVGRLPEERVVELALQLCQGLAAIHDGGVLHSDFKPNNVMIDPHGRARILGFSLAVPLRASEETSAIGLTPMYAAPEQLRFKVLVESDLYALGLVLYEMLTGIPPVEEGNDLERLKELRMVLPAPPSSLMRIEHPWLEEVILRALEPRPEDRFRSARQMAAALAGKTMPSNESENSFDKGPATRLSADGRPGQERERLDEPSEPSPPLAFKRIDLVQFKNLVSLTIDFENASPLEGNWTCIAGINGSGKSSILQAIALLMLGRRRAAELGENLLKRLRRRPQTGHSTELRARVCQGEEAIDLLLPIGEQGIDEQRLAENGHAKQADELWRQMDRQLVLAYGATRNLSSYRDTRYENLSSETLRLMTLFEPSSQIAEAAVILEGSTTRAPIETLRALLEIVLEDNELGLSVGFDPVARADQHRIIFRADHALLKADELPDGFRVLVAWLADLCISWHKIGEQQKERRSTDPRDIAGIVLLDEIDLHLHPSLQRILVPRLRKAMPKVQWIVTTHSPLILSSFDSSELVVLDRKAEGGVRQLDRQILGFSTDQVYRWLMGTEPYSAAIEDKLERDDDDVPLLLHQSEMFNEDEARRELDHWRQRVARLKARKKVG